MNAPDPSGVQGLLDPGETLLWSARPRQGVRFQPNDWYVVPLSVGVLVLSLVSTAVAAYAFASALRHGDHFEWPFLLMFVLVGLAFCAAAYKFAIGRFFSDSADRARTLYAISSARGFVVTTGAGGGVAFLRIGPDTAIQHDRRPDGSGWLKLDSADPQISDGTALGDPPSALTFDDVPNLEEALSAIQRIKDIRT